MVKKQVTDKTLSVWKDKRYYKKAGLGSVDTNHFGMKTILALARRSVSIADLGCGEGTRLAAVSEGKKGTGVDISNVGVNIAKKFYPKLKFIVSDLEKIPLRNESFDLTYSAYVLEHLANPEKVIAEAIRITKPDGHIVFVAPNFGAPNRASPVSKETRIPKLILGFVHDIIYPFTSTHNLNWKKVKPVEDPNLYTSDLDTQVEPYIGSLVGFLRFHGLKITKYSSCWEEELDHANLLQRFFGLLASFHIYPFTLWGPHLVVVAVKPKR